MKIRLPTLFLLVVSLSFLGCDKDELIPKSADYFFRVTLPDGEVINFDGAAVRHSPGSNVYFLVAGPSQCGSRLVMDSSEYIFIYHVPAAENNSGEEINTALIKSYPTKSGELTVVSGLTDEMPCVDSRSIIQREPSEPMTWRGSYTARFYTYDDNDRSCTINEPNGYAGIGEIRMEFYAPLLVCD